MMVSCRLSSAFQRGVVQALSTHRVELLIEAVGRQLHLCVSLAGLRGPRPSVCTVGGLFTLDPVGCCECVEVAGDALTFAGRRRPCHVASAACLCPPWRLFRHRRHFCCSAARLPASQPLCCPPQKWYWTIRRQTNSRSVKSRTGQLAD